MLSSVFNFLGSFTSPITIETSPGSMFWLIPLSASIAVVYKATKVHDIELGSFMKEVLGLLGSILVFMAITALVLFLFSWMVT